MMNNGLSQKISFGGLIKFTMPTIIMMILTSLYSIVDGVFVSRLINTDALSAVNIVFPLISVVIAIGTMFGSGASAVISIKNGEGRVREARENFTFIVLVSIIVGVLFAILVFLFMEPLIIFMGANDAVLDYCRDYTFALIFFIPMSILQLQFQTAMVANGKPGLGLIVSIIGGAANVVLDYVLISPMGMGIAGAAIATGIGYSVQAVFGLIYFSVQRKALIHFVKPKTDWKALLKTVTNGSSEMVSNLSTCVTTLLFNLTMMHFLGQDGVAAITVVLYMDFFLVAVGLGYSMGVAPLISYNYGSGENRNLQKIFKLSMEFLGLFSIIVTLLTIVFRSPLIEIFTPRGTDVYDIAVGGMLIFSFCYLFKCINIFASAMFTAFSNGKISALLSFARTLGFTAVFIIVLTALFGVFGIWVATPIAELCTLALSIVFIMKYRHTYHYCK